MYRSETSGGGESLLPVRDSEVVFRVVDVEYTSGYYSYLIRDRIQFHEVWEG